MHDAVIMGIKPSRAAVNYQYASAVHDGVIKPCAKGTRDVQGSHPGYLHAENSTLDKMLKDYIGMKFPGAASASSPKLAVKLNDFWLEQYSLDSAGKQFLVAFAGGELNVMVVANLDLTFEGPAGAKTIRVSGDSVHVAGVGTRTSTSLIYRGRDSIEFRVAAAMDDANNKAIAMLNSFLDSAL